MGGTEAVPGKRVPPGTGKNPVRNVSGDPEGNAGGSGRDAQPGGSHPAGIPERGVQVGNHQNVRDWGNHCPAVGKEI